MPCPAPDAPGAADSWQREKAVAVAASFAGLVGGHPSVFVATATTFFVPLTLSFGWGRTVPSLMYAASVIGIAIASIWIGRLVERIGAPRTVIASAVLLSIVLILLGAQTGSIAMAVGLSFLAGLVGAGTNLGVYLTILPKWFDGSLGRALGFTVVGISLGGILMPMIATSVTGVSGWRIAYYVLAGVHLALTLAVAGLLQWLAGKEALPSRMADRPEATGDTLSEATATPTFWVLATMIFLASLGVFGIMVHLFPLYIDRGIAPAMLPLVMVGVGLGTLSGRIVSGFLLDRVEVRAVAVAIFLIGAIGIIWLAFAGPHLSMLTILGPSLLIGVAMGAESDIIPYAVRRLFGVRHYPVVYNRLLVPHYLGAIAGTMALGWAQDSVGDPRYAVMALGISCIVASGLARAMPSTGSNLRDQAA